MLSFRSSVERQWYSRPTWLWVLLPVAWLFILLACWRRQWLLRRAQDLAVPVVVVGNITVGGTGKTPLLITLVHHLQARGFSPGVIARGYGTNVRQNSLVTIGSSPNEYGDEPILVARATGCPVAVGRDRVAAARSLLAQTQCDVILSDDGLQHYALARDIEIAVVDGERGLGNGWRLPVGPLRESKARLRSCDWVVVNGGKSPLTGVSNQVRMSLEPCNWVQVGSRAARPLAAGLPWDNQRLPVAVAGIGHPDRFFTSLRSLGIACETRAFPDHHAFTSADFDSVGDRPVIMTAKDGVKCAAFAGANWWELHVTAQVEDGFLEALVRKIRQVQACKSRRS